MGGRVGCVRERSIGVPHHHHRGNHQEPERNGTSPSPLFCFFNRQGATASSRGRNNTAQERRDTSLDPGAERFYGSL